MRCRCLIIRVDSIVVRLCRGELCTPSCGEGGGEGGSERGGGARGDGGGGERSDEGGGSGASGTGTVGTLLLEVKTLVRAMLEVCVSAERSYVAST